MTQNEQQRTILRRINEDAPSSAEVANRVKESPAITLLQENAPSTLLVEGSPDVIAKVVGGVSGWSASPMMKYQVPDPRPRVLKPAG